MKPAHILFLISAIGLGIASCNKGTRTIQKDEEPAVKEVIKEVVKRDTLYKTLTKTIPFNFEGTKDQFTDFKTPNYDLRKPNFVIIHHTAQKTCDYTMYTFSLERTQVSSHYVICKDGTVIQLLNDYMRAWHGGISRWGNSTDINSNSIGIELDNDGFAGFPQAQINALLTLLETLKTRHKIPAYNFIGHADIAPTRKNDPNKTFPWQQLAEQGFGVWYDKLLPPLPEFFSETIALRIIGYDISNVKAAKQAFARKYFKKDKYEEYNEEEKRILYNLMIKNLEPK
jgi:N-acetylmuramoyl-L-alanine amidase